MRVAFPVKEDSGLNSVIDEHFGTAQNFLIVDTDTRQVEHKENIKLSGESACKTGIFKKKDRVDAVVTKCMGDGSQRNLAKVNIRVFQAQKDTISENLELLEKEALKLFHIFDFCHNKKNKKEGGCGHH